MKTHSTFVVKVTKEATIHFYCLFYQSRFSDICTIKELKELNWLCKYMENVRSSQLCFSINFCTEFRKAQIEYRSMRVSLNNLYFPMQISTN